MAIFSKADCRFIGTINIPVGTRHCRVPTRAMYLTYLTSATYELARLLTENYKLNNKQ
jgi:hypothetical protein